MILRWAGWDLRQFLLGLESYGRGLAGRPAWMDEIDEADDQNHESASTATPNYSDPDVVLSAPEREAWHGIERHLKRHRSS